VSPHFNVGYQFNGDSILAGDLVSGEEGSLPNVFSWSAGTTIAASRRLTLVTDILGMTLIDSPRLVQTTAVARGSDAGSVGIPQASGLALAPENETFSMLNGAFGIKLKVSERLVLQYNVLVSFDDNSLRDSVVPLVGLGYTF
jgi:hypothetical protein